MFKLAPSILTADFSRLGEEVASIERAGAHLIHIDVMDGHFVPNISFGAVVVKSLAGKTALPFDVHLMIENPDRYISGFVTEKTGYITVHQETCTHLHRTVQHIKSFGVKAGVAINPATPPSSLDCLLGDIDMVLIMTVNPGFGGQELIPSCLDKLRHVSELKKNGGFKYEIEIDGGVTQANIKEVVAAGADIVVAGNAVFAGGRAYENTRSLLGIC